MAKTGMPAENNSPTAVEQAVARAVRENLERLQRTTAELQQAVNDTVAACEANKPTVALGPMLRAQTASASISAALEVLTKFIASSLHVANPSPLEQQTIQALRAASMLQPAAAPPTPQVVKTQPLTLPEVHDQRESARIETPSEPVHADEVLEHAGTASGNDTQYELHSAPETIELEVPASEVPAEPQSAADFDVNRLSPEDQELHRRANRVAKVSMQDIKMLRPEQVRLGRENRDVCIRLKDDIEKAHREYERRFRAIMDHPVDYFHHWMVEILAGGDAQALGEYPYATTAREH